MMSEENHIEEEIVQGIKNGDQRKFGQFLEEYWHTLYYFVFRLIRNPTESETIVSETFSKLWKLRANFDKYSSMRAFLYVTARNGAYDFLRYEATRKKNKEILPGDLEELAAAQTDNSPGALNNIIQAELLKEAYKELQSLPEQRKKVLTLFFVEDQTTDQVAERLGISIELVRNIKAQALKQLRNKMLHKLLSLMLFFSILF
jgi:RNA polymerase sigma factor (sigma-70 family)